VADKACGAFAVTCRSREGVYRQAGGSADRQFGLKNENNIQRIRERRLIFRQGSGEDQRGVPMKVSLLYPAARI